MSSPHPLQIVYDPELFPVRALGDAIRAEQQRRQWMFDAMLSSVILNTRPQRLCLITGAY